MCRKLLGCAVLTLLAVLSVCGKKAEFKYRSIEVKHFSKDEGVELPADFADLLYAELRKQLHKSGHFEQILGENEVVDSSEADRSVILEGNFVGYKKGSAAQEMIPYVGLFKYHRTLKTQFTLRRRSDSEKLLEKEITVKLSAHLKPQTLANVLALRITRELKKA